jgi:tripartite-type tricarboxylate transporter receptor subunit TctC
VHGDVDEGARLLPVLEVEVVSGTPESLAARLKADMAHWEPVVRASGFTAEE